jgi:hypothetical protein
MMRTRFHEAYQFDPDCSSLIIPSNSVLINLRCVAKLRINSVLTMDLGHILIINGVHASSASLRSQEGKQNYICENAAEKDADDYSEVLALGSKV